LDAAALRFLYLKIKRATAKSSTPKTMRITPTMRPTPSSSPPELLVLALRSMHSEGTVGADVAGGGPGGDAAAAQVV
jgi:hypothetical protein